MVLLLLIYIATSIPFVNAMEYGGIENPTEYRNTENWSHINDINDQK